MKKLSSSARFLALASLIFASSCTSDSPAPVSTDITTPVGTYRTNGLLDFSCVAISDPAQMPVLKITQTADGYYSLARTDFLPSKRTSKLDGVTVQAKLDTLLLFSGSKKIGSLQMGTWRDFSGKAPRDVAAPLIQITHQDTTGQNPLFYYGYRQ